MIELLGGRRLEGDDLALARRHTVHGVLHGAVLSGAQRVVDEQHRPAIVAVLSILQVEEPIDAPRQRAGIGLADRRPSRGRVRRRPESDGCGAVDGPKR